MAGLTGQVVDVPYAITANMLILQLQDTSLQNSCAEPGMMQAVSACCYALSLHSDLFRPVRGSARVSPDLFRPVPRLNPSIYMSKGLPCDHLLVQKDHAVCAPTQGMCDIAAVGFAFADKTLQFSVQLTVDQA